MPGFAISHTHIEGAELGLRLGLRSWTHPGEGIDSLAERGNNIGDHGLGLSFGLGWKVAVGVNLSDIVAQQTIDQTDSTLPSHALLGRARKNFSEEGKPFLSESLRQCPGISFNQMKCQPVLPCIERGRSH